MPRLYPLGDTLNAEERNFFNCKHGIKAIKTREYRCPKQGEWFLSGAVPTAYRAPNDLSYPYTIAKLAQYTEQHVYQIQKVKES